MRADPDLEMIDTASQGAGDSLTRPAGDHASAAQVSPISQTSQINRSSGNPMGISNPLLLAHNLDSTVQSGLNDFLVMFQTIDLIQNANRIWEPICEVQKAKFAAGDRAAGRGIAFEVLLRDNVPHSIRSRMYIIIACTPGERLHHARQAVKEARKGIKIPHTDVNVSDALDVIRRAEQTFNIILDWGVHDDTPGAISEHTDLESTNDEDDDTQDVDNGDVVGA